MEVHSGERVGTEVDARKEDGQSFVPVSVGERFARGGEVRHQTRTCGGQGQGACGGSVGAGADAFAVELDEAFDGGELEGVPPGKEDVGNIWTPEVPEEKINDFSISMPECCFDSGSIEARSCCEKKTDNIHVSVF